MLVKDIKETKSNTMHDSKLHHGSGKKFLWWKLQITGATGIFENQTISLDNNII